MVLKIPISFKKNEKHIYDYIKSKRNYSDYIKDLVEEDMKKNTEVKPVKRNKNDFSIDI